jgi:gliding motility-associated-like protein
MCQLKFLIPLLFFISPYALGTPTEYLSVNTDSCNTPTFYQRIKDAQGRKIELKELQTLPGGNFVAAGNITLSANNQEGLLLKYSNAGTILLQQQLRVDNKPISIFDMKITLLGKIILTGTINDGSNALFILQLNESFILEWTKIISNSSATTKLTLQLFDDKIALASQQNSAVLCSILDNSGNFLWTRIISIPDLVSLAGFGQFNWSPVGLIVNCFRSGKNLVELFEIDGATGNPVSNHILGDGLTENVCLETIAFTAEAHLLGVVKKAPNDYRLVRYNTFKSSTIETEHNYKITGTVDFNISASMDNAADAMGFCLPQDGKLIFIKQFSAYQTSPEYTREYNVPLGASIKAITRSLDGGFLFGLNTIGSDEIILIKTDSIGTLPGCGFTDIANEFHEIFTVNNTPVNRLSNPLNLSVTAAIIINGNATINSLFDCNQYFCPPAPVVDTCLSTYYKTFRSGSYAATIGGYSIMRNDRRLVVNTDIDRILGGTNQLKSGLHLLDEKGNFIKGVTIRKDNVSPSFAVYKMTDSTIMLIQYFTSNGFGCYNYSLLTDDFQMVWTKTIKTNQELINGEGYIYGGYHRDAEGNFYVVGSTPGYFAKPKVNVLKMDANGNQLWARSYEFTEGVFSTVRVTSTNTSLMVVVEGNTPGGVSVRIDKNSGQMLNSFVYQNVYNGGNSLRYLDFINDRLVYFGNDHDDHLIMALFDTTGKPYRLKKIITTPTIFRAGTFKDGKFYGMYEYYNGTFNKDVLMKVDSSLNIDWVTESVMDPYGLPSGIAVGNNGNIYVAGNYYYGWNAIYAEAYLRKYSSTGTIGTCNFDHVTPVVQDVNPNPVILGFTESTLTFPPETYSFDMIPDTAGQTVARILCSSISVCDSIHLSGPDTVCQLNTPYAFRINKNPGCLLNNEMVNDTANYQVTLVTDSSAIINFKKPGNVWLKVFINTGCKIISDSLEIHVSPVLTSIDLGRDTTLCPGDSLMLSAGSGFGSYQWQDGSSGSNFIVKDSGLYFVTVRNQCGELFSDSVVVALFTVPSLNLPLTTTVCSLDTVSVSNPAGFVNYTWQPAVLVNNISGGIFVTPQQNTWISLAAVTSNSCKVTDSFLIRVNPLPIVSLGRDISFCDYDSVRLSGGNGYAAYLWSTGNTSSAIIASTPGIYWLQVKNSNGCKASDSIQLFHYPHTQVNLGADFNLCAGNSKVLDAQNFSRYLWQDNSVSQNFTASTTGLYHVLVTDANGCKSTDSVAALNVFPLPANFLNSVDSICQNQSLTITPTRSFSNYVWADNSSLSYLKISGPGQYWVTVTDANGCTGSDSIEVFAKDCFQGLYFPNAFTPNGDSKNDVFRPKIYGIPAMYMLEIFNRYGELVFYTSDPIKGWDGMYKGMPAVSGNYVWQCRYTFNTRIERYAKGNVVLIRQ